MADESRHHVQSALDRAAVIAATITGFAAAGLLLIPKVLEERYAAANSCDLGSIGAALGGMAIGLGVFLVAVIAAAVRTKRRRVLLVLPLGVARLFLGPSIELPGPAYPGTCGEPLPLLAPLLLGVLAGAATYALARTREPEVRS